MFEKKVSKTNLEKTNQGEESGQSLSSYEFSAKKRGRPF
jgi:hypothetical protein